MKKHGFLLPAAGKSGGASGPYKGKLAKTANPSVMQAFVFTPPKTESPAVWREEGIETEELFCWIDPTKIWISDRLHDEIEKNFPRQMWAYKQAELD